MKYVGHTIYMKRFFVTFLFGWLKVGTDVIANEHKESFWGDEYVPKLDFGGFTTVNLLKTIEFYT